MDAEREEEKEEVIASFEARVDSYLNMGITSFDWYDFHGERLGEDPSHTRCFPTHRGNKLFYKALCSCMERRDYKLSSISERFPPLYRFSKTE
jgi:hypothetical protein